MDSIRSQVIVVIFATIIGTITELMIPNSKLDKTIKTVLSVFLICVAINPVFSTAIQLPSCFRKNHRDCTNQEFGQKVSEQSEDLIKKNIKELAENELNEKNISFQRVCVFIDTKYDDQIHITIHVYISSDCRSNFEIKEILEKKLGLETIVSEE